jgi:hypothetical protein
VLSFPVVLSLSTGSDERDMSEIDTIIPAAGRRRLLCLASCKALLSRRGADRVKAERDAAPTLSSCERDKPSAPAGAHETAALAGSTGGR